MTTKHKLLHWLLLLVAVAILGWALFVAFKVSAYVASGLMSVGWAAYLKMTSPNPLRFTFSCLSQASCTSAYTQAWLKAYPLFLPVLGLVPLWGVAILKVVSQKEGVQKPPGGARWAEPKDLTAFLKGERDNPSRGYLGLLASGKILRPPERLRCSHTLVIGGTGARKSTGYYKPNMVKDAQDKVSGIIIDLKYPDARGGFFDMVRMYGQAGHDVQLVLPYSEHTLHLPVMAGADTLAGASELATMIVPVTVQDDAASFFRNQERQLLAGLLLGLAKQGEFSMRRLYRLLLSGTSEVQRFVRRHPEGEVREVLTGFFEQDARTQAGISAGLAGRLQLFDNPRLDAATTASPNPKKNVDLEGLGLRPSLLYIGIPQEHLQGGQGQVLLQLVKRAIDRALIRTASAHGGQLPVQVSFYLDEFANMGRLPNVSENFATMRSRKVAYHVTLQNRGQVEALYGRGSFNAMFANNFHQTLIYPRYLRFDDAEYFSKALGSITVIEKVLGVATSGWWDETRNEVVREVARPLLSTEEMMSWPEALGVVMINGVPPVRTILPRLDERKALTVKNPLHKVYKSFPKTVDPEEMAKVIIGKRVALTHEEEVAAAQAKLEALKARLGFEEQEEQSASPEPTLEAAPEAAPEVVVAQEEATSARDAPKEADKPAAPVVRPSMGGNHKPPAANHKPGAEHAAPKGPQGNDLQKNFVDWVDAAIAQHSQAEIHTLGGAVSKVAINRSALAPELLTSAQFKAWQKRGWVNLKRDEVGIIGDGLKWIGTKRIKAFAKLSEFDAEITQAQGGDGERTTADEDDLSTGSARLDPAFELGPLRDWIEENGHLLEGHPKRKPFEGEKDAPVAVGQYQECAVFLPQETLEGILRMDALPGGLRKQQKKMRLTQERRRLVGVPYPLLKQLAALLGWLEVNACLLEGHPSWELLDAEGQAEVIGIFEERLVALPKEMMEEILGDLPETVKERRWGGKRLVEIAIGVEL